jgi:hypothetical protein
MQRRKKVALYLDDYQRFPSLETFLRYSESKAISFAAVCDTLSCRTSWIVCRASHREHGAPVSGGRESRRACISPLTWGCPAAPPRCWQAQ